LIGQEALERVSLQQFGTLTRRQGVTAAQRPAILRGGLAVRSQSGGAVGGGGRELEHRGRVVGCLGMMREPRQVARSARRVAQRLERGPVQAGTPVRVDRLLHCDPRQLVPERHGRSVGAQHARREAVVERIERVAGDRLEQPELCALGHDRHGVQDVACPGPEPRCSREHGVTDRRGQLAAAAGKRLRHEERIAAGLGMKIRGVDAVRACEQRDGLR
jgi:hypothetical protein